MVPFSGWRQSAFGRGRAVRRLGLNGKKLIFGLGMRQIVAGSLPRGVWRAQCARRRHGHRGFTGVYTPGHLSRYSFQVDAGGIDQNAGGDAQNTLPGGMVKSDSRFVENRTGRWPAHGAGPAWRGGARLASRAGHGSRGGCCGHARQPNLRIHRLGPSPCSRPRWTCSRAVELRRA